MRINLKITKEGGPGKQSVFTFVLRTMDEDTTSNFSSIADAPDHLRKQYTPLNEVFLSHPTEFPQRGPPESDSDG